MNTASKGSRLERTFDALLKSHGFITHRALRTHFQANDIWGLWDVAAFTLKHPWIHHFQISTVWKSGEARRAIEAFQFPTTICKSWLVRRQDRKDFELKLWNMEAWLPFSLEEFFAHYG